MRQKRGGFLLLGGRYMLKRESGSKRESFPPKEFLLVCTYL